jgi:hypothetical protein
MFVHRQALKSSLVQGGRLMDMQAAEPAGHYSQASIWGHLPPEEPLRPGMLERISPA